MLFPQFAFAGGVGSTMFQMLQLPADAYDASLAKTSFSGVNSAVSNPSVIPFLSRSVTFTYMSYLEDTGYGLAGVNVPVGKSSGINFSFSYFDLGTMKRTVEDGLGGYTEDGNFGAGDKIFNISYGAAVGYGAYAGISLKYVKEVIDDVSYEGFAGHISGLYFFNKNLFCTAGINNFGQQIAGYDLPTNLYFGLCGNVSGNTSVTIQSDNLYNDDIYELKLAAEVGLDDISFIRAGYVCPIKKHNGSNDDFINNVTAGIGFKFDFISIDYAWLPKGDFGNSHMFSILIKF